MFIEFWNEEFQAHFIVGEHPPPVFVYDVARALIGNRVITAVRTTYEIGRASSEGIERPATWRSWLVLDQSSVAHFEVTFDAVFYDEYEERDRGSQPVPGSVTTCWQRSLADVVGYRITGFGPVAAEPQRWGALHGVELTFGLPPESWRRHLCCLRLNDSDLLVLDWRQQPRGAVPALSVVEVMAPGRDDGTSLGLSSEVVPREHFVFQGGEERLAGGVVEGTSRPAPSIAGSRAAETVP